MQNSTEQTRHDQETTKSRKALYEPPLLAEAGAFAEETRGGSGNYREAGVGRFL